MRRWRWRSDAARWRPPAPLFSSLFNYRHSPQEAAESLEAALAWTGIEMLDGRGADQLSAGAGSG